jgi:hypothetical protein
VGKLKHKFIGVQPRWNYGLKPGNKAIEQLTPMLIEVNYKDGITSDVVEERPSSLRLQINNREHDG